MSITYTWKLTSIKTLNESPYQDAIVQAYWDKIGTDLDGNVGIYCGSSNFSTAELSPEEPFIPINEITEAQVLNWIQAKIDPTYELIINNQIETQITNNVIPNQKPEIPWLIV